MPWYKVQATITMDIEADDAEGAQSKAETILNKRVIGQSFGFRKNDQGQVTDWSGDLTPDLVDDDEDHPMIYDDGEEE